MKIAFITSSAPFGNGESFVIAEANALAKAGINVLLIPTLIRSGRCNRFVLESGVELCAASIFSRAVIKASLGSFLMMPVRTISALCAILCWHPVILLKNIMVFPKALWVHQLMRAHDVDHIHAHWVSTPSTVAMVCGMLSGVSWSCTAHRSDIVANNLLCKKLYHARFMRFISKSGIQLAKKVCSAVEDKARLLHMGVAVPTDQLPSSGAQHERFCILCPANLVRVKGHTFLIKALLLLKSKRPIELWLAGDGELRGELESLVNALDLRAMVRFLGHVAHDSLLDMYRQSKVDAVVLPSVDLGRGVHEGIPVSLMEAMAYGVPVISTWTGGIPELLENGAGILVPHSDSAAIAKEIDCLLESHGTSLGQGVRGRARVAEEFNERIITGKMIALFKEAADSVSVSREENK